MLNLSNHAESKVKEFLARDPNNSVVITVLSRTELERIPCVGPRPDWGLKVKLWFHGLHRRHESLARYCGVEYLSSTLADMVAEYEYEHGNVPRQPPQEDKI